jgi:hypothetical protein
MLSCLDCVSAFQETMSGAFSGGNGVARGMALRSGRVVSEAGGGAGFDTCAMRRCGCTAEGPMIDKNRKARRNRERQRTLDTG